MAENKNRLPDEHEIVPDESKKKDKKKKENFFKRAGAGLAHWFKEMKGELKKVVWPTKSQIINNSVIAIVLIIVSAIVIWGFDQVAMYCVDAIISLGG